MSLTKFSRSIAGSVVFITGAASGMGEATAKLFASEGAKVAAVDINEEGLDRVVSEINNAGAEAKAWCLDLTDGASIKSVMDDVVSHFGGLDLLINNAGVYFLSPIDGDQFEEQWGKSIEILLTAHARTIRAALPYLRESAHPRIVNVASTEALGATKHGSPYSAAKAGVIGLTRALAVELGPEGITVNCICPGPVHTAMTDEIPDEQKQQFAGRRVALKRYADPEEVAHGTLNFCLPASSFITGTVLPVDGGLTIKNA